MNRIKELRLKNKLSQTDIAKLLGVTRQAVSLYEQGKRQLNKSDINTLTKYFNVSIPYIKSEIFYNDLSDKEKKIFDRIYNNLANEHLSIYSEIKIISALLNGKKRLKKYEE